MSDRYSKLFALPENLYSAGAPVVIAAGALQKDNQTGKVFAQLKLRSIQDKAVKAATVKITPFDTVGKPLGGTVDYQYLDLSAGRDTDFGQKTPVILPEAATRSFTVSVSEVIFSDNSIWTDAKAEWEPLSAPVTPGQAFTDGELVKQYWAEYGADCKCVFKKEKDLWRCACGAINHSSETNCHHCQREAAKLAALDVGELKADRDKRLAAEQEKAAEETMAAQARAKKNKMIAMIATPIIIIAIVAAVLISNAVEKSNAYNAAVALVEAGQYDEAIAAFTELGDYKDSAEQIEAMRLDAYNAAVALAEAGQYDEAIAAFTELGDYRDSAEQIEATRLDAYNAAVALVEAGQFDEAISSFNALALEDYKDSYEYRAALSMMELSLWDLRDLEFHGIKGLKEVCESYLPYCGMFTGYYEGDKMTLRSDFRWYNGEFVWTPHTFDGSMFGLKYGSSSHYFFESGMYPLNESMEATDKYLYCIGKARLNSGSIHITVKTLDDSSTFYDINYTKES